MQPRDRHRWFVPLIASILLIGCHLLTFAPQLRGDEPTPALPAMITGTVTGAYDGDSITVKDERDRVFKIRLEGIDCPELAQAHGREARDFTRAKVLGKQVVVQITDRDRYSRWIGTVWYGDARDESLNRELVKQGHAWHYEQYSNDDSLGKLEQKARKERRGLWADEAAIAPWEWRRQRAEARRNRSSRVVPIRNLLLSYVGAPAQWLGPHYLTPTRVVLN